MVIQFLEFHHVADILVKGWALNVLPGLIALDLSLANFFRLKFELFNLIIICNGVTDVLNNLVQVNSY